MKTKVYYADTDAGGVVYYANYLRWLEMARADWLEESGVSLAEYVRQGTVFAVVRVEIDYHTHRAGRKSVVVFYRSAVW